MNKPFSLPLTALAELFCQAFKDYLVPISSDPVALAARIRQEQIDLAASLVIRVPNGELAGLALVARRSDTSRLAGMGITSPWRGQEAGQALVTRVVQEARDRGDRRMVLEVIEQNTPAVRLYEKSGFVALRRLVGYEASHIVPLPAALEEASIAEYAAAVARHGEPSLPWQLAAATSGGVTLPAVAFRSGQAVAVVVVTPDVLALRGIVVDSSCRRQGHARRLLGGLATRFPGRRWVVPAIVPVGLADDFFLFSTAFATRLSRNWKWRMICPAGSSGRRRTRVGVRRHA